MRLASLVRRCHMSWRQRRGERPHLLDRSLVSQSFRRSRGRQLFPRCQGLQSSYPTKPAMISPRLFDSGNSLAHFWCNSSRVTGWNPAGSSGGYSTFTGIKHEHASHSSSKSKPFAVSSFRHLIVLVKMRLLPDRKSAVERRRGAFHPPR
jgi:hypothetical protein